MDNLSTNQLQPPDISFRDIWHDAIKNTWLKNDEIVALLTPPVLYRINLHIQAWEYGYQWMKWLKHGLSQHKPPRKNSKAGRTFYLYELKGKMILEMFDICELLHGSQAIYGQNIPYKSSGDWLLRLLFDIQYDQVLDSLPIPEGCEVIVSPEVVIAESGKSTKKKRARKTPKEKAYTARSLVIEQLKNGQIPDGWEESMPDLAAWIETVQTISSKAGEKSEICKKWKKYLSAYGKWTRFQIRSPHFSMSYIEDGKLKVQDRTGRKKTIAL